LIKASTLLGLFPSHVTLIYSIYGLLYTTFGLGVRHHPAGRPVGSTRASQEQATC
jgi:hypothetical protein